MRGQGRDGFGTIKVDLVYRSTDNMTKNHDAVTNDEEQLSKLGRLQSLSNLFQERAQHPKSPCRTVFKNASDGSLASADIGIENPVVISHHGAHIARFRLLIRLPERDFRMVARVLAGILARTFAGSFIPMKV